MEAVFRDRETLAQNEAWSLSDLAVAFGTFNQSSYSVFCF